jgi:PAS domain S-box-containing protein
MLAAQSRQLRRVEQTYRTLVGQAHEGILTWNPETLEILEANPRAAELLGERPRDLRGRSLAALLAPQTRSRRMRELRAASHNGTVCLRDLVIRRSDGKAFPAEIAASIVRFDEGELVLGVLRDLTAKRDLDRKAALLAEQLIETEKMTSIGLLAAGVAHEINNPMGYVASNVNRLIEHAQHMQHLLWHSTPTEERAKIAGMLAEMDDLAQESHEGVRRVTRIVGALREFAHGGRAVDAYEQADLNRIVRNCLTLLHNRIKDRVQVDLELQPLPAVHCHPTQIAQVFMNLLLNAAQAVGHPGRIHVASYDSGDRVHVAVEDDGCGIDSDHLRRIFEPFFTTKPVGEGTGLGLAVSREIVRRHGGELSVDSVPGKGSRFLVELPRQARPPGESRGPLGA